MKYLLILSVIIGGCGKAQPNVVVDCVNLYAAWDAKIDAYVMGTTTLAQVESDWGQLSSTDATHALANKLYKYYFRCSLFSCSGKSMKIIYGSNEVLL